MRLIITRPEEDSQSLAAELARRGHEAIVAPLMRIASRQVVLARRHYQAIAITSANALRAPALSPLPDWLIDCKVFAVGARSRAAARRAGFRQVVAGGGDVAGLAALIAGACMPEKGRILYPSGSETTGDLKAELEKRGFPVDRVVLYDAVAETELPGILAAVLRQGSADGVLLYSPRSARIWVSLVAGAGWQTEAFAITHYCLSHNVAAALPSGTPIKVAVTPHEDALLALLDPGV
jgi:uroporphyrinogen-III synthase